MTTKANSINERTMRALNRNQERDFFDPKTHAAYGTRVETRGYRVPWHQGWVFVMSKQGSHQYNMVDYSTYHVLMLRENGDVHPVPWQQALTRFRKKEEAISFMQDLIDNTAAWPFDDEGKPI